jgi:hypothetical protein
VTIDGVPRGATPIAGLELPAGVHRLECVPPKGRKHTASVNVTGGASARHKFTLGN